MSNRASLTGRSWAADWRIPGKTLSSRNGLNSAKAENVQPPADKVLAYDRFETE